MPKIITDSKFKEWEGLDRIQTTVHAMKCVYREITKDDYGIDGEIEIVVPLPDGKGYQVSGGVIKFQSKSGKKYVIQDGPDSFASPVSKDDLELWNTSNHPTLYIVYHPVDDKLYWKEVRSYVKNTPNVFQPPLKIVFDKVKDNLTPDSYRTLAAIAEASPPRIRVGEQERLFSNLLRVKRHPSIWTAPAKIKNIQEAYDAIEGTVPPAVIIDEMLYTLSNLNYGGSVLRQLCDTEKVGRLALVESWWMDDNRRRDYVFMLSRLLSIHLSRCKVRYTKDFKRHYFLCEDEKRLEFNHAWYNIRTKRNAPERITAKFYQYGLDAYWRHLAARFTFKMIGMSWYLQIVPQYFYTYDGKRPYASDRVGAFATQIKAEERNQHVLNHVLFWADVLSWPNVKPGSRDTISIFLDRKTVMTLEKLPLSGVANFSIPYDPAIYEVPETTGQLSFDWLNHMNDEDDTEEDGDGGDDYDG